MRRWHVGQRRGFNPPVPLRPRDGAIFGETDCIVPSRTPHREMSGKKHAYVNDEYRRWQTIPVTVDGRALALDSKPGVFAHGALDPSSLLLAQHVRVGSGETMVHMNCRNGL